MLLPIVHSRRVGQDPLPELGDAGADAREVGLGAPNAPADYAAQEPAPVLSLHHQRTAGITLKEHTQTGQGQGQYI